MSDTSVQGPVHTRPEEFENEGLSLKTQLMISLHTNHIRIQQSPVTRSGKSYDCRDVIVSKNSTDVQNVFHPRGSYKQAFSYSSGLKSVFFERFRFRDGLVCKNKKKLQK